MSVDDPKNNAFSNVYTALTNELNRLDDAPVNKLELEAARTLLSRMSDPTTLASRAQVVQWMKELLEEMLEVDESSTPEALVRIARHGIFLIRGAAFYLLANGKNPDRLTLNRLDKQEENLRWQRFTDAEIERVFRPTA
ncbi:hypothetical protein HY213_03745 [Candidatus Peregrinibacteria bacterium]|nr:hypothetical protein [Candidatus Peregrinibacteria bacterium]